MSKRPPRNRRRPPKSIGISPSILRKLPELDVGLHVEVPE
jgi:hypothetical protein